jgi:hypothetical protein
MGTRAGYLLQTEWMYAWAEQDTSLATAAGFAVTKQTRSEISKDDERVLSHGFRTKYYPTLLCTDRSEYNGILLLQRELCSRIKTWTDIKYTVIRI